ncbi:hypothetical protein FEP08_04689 [Burkholderia multivorans]|nr:hypothetical protein [Burkholderia multivorans]
MKEMMCIGKAITNPRASRAFLYSIVKNAEDTPEPKY